MNAHITDDANVPV